MTRCVQARSAVLSPESVESLINDLIPFATFVTDTFPDVATISQLDRAHVEAFLTWNRTERTWRGRKACDRTIGPAVAHSTVLSVRKFLDDITLWGWADRPHCPLLFPTDVPKLPRTLPPSADARHRHRRAAGNHADPGPARTHRAHAPAPRRPAHR